MALAAALAAFFSLFLSEPTCWAGGASFVAALAPNSLPVTCLNVNYSAAKVKRKIFLSQWV
jgi:hypothetical protein